MNFKKYKEKQNKYENCQTYDFYLHLLYELAATHYEVLGLPPSINQRYFFTKLISRGSMLYFHDDVIGDLCLPFAGSQSNLTIYEDPYLREVHMPNGYTVTCTPENSVIIWYDFLHTCPLRNIEMYARRLANIDRTIDVNIAQQKTPRIVMTSEQQRLTVVNALNKIDQYENTIIGNEHFNMDGLQVYDITAPYVTDKLQAQKKQILGEALTYLGIENDNNGKKERELSDEVVSNMGIVSAMSQSKLASLEECFDKVNSKFGANIVVQEREGFNMTLQKILNEGSLINNE